jgi:hypothetical protein
LKGEILLFVVKAIYDGVNFKLTQPIPVKESYEVYITFVEPLRNDTPNTAKLPRSTGKGIWKDRVWMSDDFNEPLEEMKEYME